MSSVEKDSPADKAGLKQGDVIVRFDGEAVRSAAQLRRLVGETPAKRPVTIEVSRAGAPQKLSATLAERNADMFGGEDFPGMRSFHFELPEPPAPPNAPGMPHPPHAPRAPHVQMFRHGGPDEDVLIERLPGFGGPRKLGIQFIDMGEQLAAAYKLQAKSGVLVTSVDEGGPAAKAGLKAGDVVLKFQGKAIEDAGDLREAVAAADGGSEVSVTVQREGRPSTSRRRWPSRRCATAARAGRSFRSGAGGGRATAPRCPNGLRAPRSPAPAACRPVTRAGPSSRFASGTSIVTIPARPKPSLSASQRLCQRRLSRRSARGG